MNELYSRRYYDDLSVKKLSIDSLAEIAKQANHITILSAYYSTTFLYKFFSLVPKKTRTKCEISIILNGFAGFRLEEQREDLESLEEDLQNLEYKSIKIYLNTDSPLFHSKLYCFHTKNNSHWFIGSANASDSAFAQNEEILLHFTSPYAPFEHYLKKVIQNSVYYKNIEDIDINCMVKFWRTGLIYYKPNANIQFTFSRLKIPNWVKKELTQNQNPPPYSNPGEPWGPFNIKLALGFEDEEEKIQARHNPWSIETCFGYWVPFTYKERLDQKIDEASDRKSDIFQEILEEMEEVGEEKFLGKFNDYILAIKNNLDSIYSNYKWKINDRIIVKYDNEYYKGTIIKVKKANIDISFDDGDTDTIRKDSIRIAGLGKKKERKKGIPENELTSHLKKEFWRPPEILHEQFKKFADRVANRLRDERHVERASSPLIPSTMPEIWSDSIALDEFSESFFEYISYRLNMSSKPLIIRLLQLHCKLEEGDDWEDIGDKIEEHINQNGWPNDNWLVK